MLIPLVLLATYAGASDPAIRAHLHQVADTLRSETRAELNYQTRARRLDLLNVLDQYADAGEFPQHTTPAHLRPRQNLPPRWFDPGDRPRAPLFVDERGSHCAVGYLMAVTEPALAATIAARENGAFLPEMTTSGVDKWAVHHGLTLDELAWIQPGYPATPLPDCNGFEPKVDPEPPGQWCEGQDLALFGQQQVCHECDGPLRVWIPVGHRGGEVLEDATVVVYQGDWIGTGDILETITVGDLRPLERRLLGPIVLDGSLEELGQQFISAVITEGPSCDERGRELNVFNSPTDDEVWSWTYPEACPNGGPVSPDVDEPVSARCSSAASGSSVVLALVAMLGLVGRRRQRFAPYNRAIQAVKRPTPVATAHGLVRAGF